MSEKLEILLYWESLDMRSFLREERISLISFVDFAFFRSLAMCVVSLFYAGPSPPPFYSYPLPLVPFAFPCCYD